MVDITLRILGDFKGVLEFQRKLTDAKWIEKRIMAGIGAIILASAQKAFREQRLGEIPWEPRYPKQAEPFVNIAGVVADFIAGRASPPDRRFDRRPAGIDTGLLLRSLTPGQAIGAHGYSVVVGSTNPHASAVQYGALSVQPVTKAVKIKLAAWMKRERGARKRAGKQGGIFQTKKGVKTQKRTTMGQALRVAAMAKLGFLFKKDVKELRTHSGPRPYLGVTDEAQHKIVEHIQTVFTELGAAVKVAVVRGR